LNKLLIIITYIEICFIFKLYRETKYSESDGASYLESYLSHNDQWPNNINYEDESFHQGLYLNEKNISGRSVFFTNSVCVDVHVFFAFIT
jgi:hypothetical protein